MVACSRELCHHRMRSCVSTTGIGARSARVATTTLQTFLQQYRNDYRIRDTAYKGDATREKQASREGSSCSRQYERATAEATPYYWNAETNETAWERPVGWVPEEVLAAEPCGEASRPHSRLTEEELMNILLNADTSRFGDVVDKYRPQCFEDAFFEYLTGKIIAMEDQLQRERLEKLRARLSNPLLKNPPPY